MDISKVKYFVHQDVLQDTMIYAKDFETIETIEDFDIGLYGIVETFEPFGLTLFSDYEEAAIAGIEYVLDCLI